MTRRRMHRRGLARRLGRRAAVAAGAAALLLSAADGTQDAVANGDIRTIHILHEHTKESASVTFRRNGQYDAAALKQLNWLLRDWRLDEPIAMDPRLFDIVWQVYREVGAREPVHVVSAYRSPQTNAALRQRSRAVAEHSQHMLGKAMDFFIPEVSMARVREIAMRLQHGGVGFYPNSQHSFVHLDAGSVRSWPRMPRPLLARIFPDGRTVHIPKDGKPMAGYEEAKSTILARGGSVAGYATYAEAGEESSGPRRSLWATLFGGGSDEDAEDYGGRRGAAAPAGNSDDAGTRSFFSGARPSAPEGSRPTARARMAALPNPDEPQPGLPVAGRPDETPMPPRRPGDLPAVAKTVLPAVGQAQAAPAAPQGEMRAPPRPSATVLPGDDRAALRSLFDAAATPTVSSRAAEVATSRSRVQPLAAGATVAAPDARVRTSFSSAHLGGPAADAFTGPAVQPLPTLR